MPTEDKDKSFAKKADVIKHLCSLISDTDMLKQKLMYNYIRIGHDFKTLMTKYKVSNVELDKILRNKQICLGGYSRPMRSKYMALYDIAMEYNAIMYTSPNSISNVLNNLNNLKFKMSEDKGFDWKQCGI